MHYFEPLLALFWAVGTLLNSPMATAIYVVAGVVSAFVWAETTWHKGSALRRWVKAGGLTVLMLIGADHLIWISANTHPLMW